MERLNWRLVLAGVAFLAAVLLAQAAERSASMRQFPPASGLSATFRYYPQTEADVVADADAVVRGTVVAVSAPYWNQDSHQSWEGRGAPSASDDPVAAPFPLQDVTLAVQEVWYDAILLPFRQVTFSVPGTGIGEAYNREGASLALSSEVVVCLEQRALGWREGGHRVLLTLSGAYQGVYQVIGKHGRLGNAAQAVGDQEVRSESVEALRRIVDQRRNPSPEP